MRKLGGLLAGRVVAGLEVDSDRLVLQFTDGSALMLAPKAGAISVRLREVADPAAPGARDRPTRRQREYLDFIRAYMARYRASPAEADIQQHFMVSAPSAHQMVKTLERRGFISRDRDFFGNVVPRTIRVLVD